jgi:hypothetical protein
MRSGLIFRKNIRFLIQYIHWLHLRAPQPIQIFFNTLLPLRRQAAIAHHDHIGTAGLNAIYKSILCCT